MGCVLPAGQGQAPARQAATRRAAPRGGRGHREQGLRLGPEGGGARRATPSPPARPTSWSPAAWSRCPTRRTSCPRRATGYRMGNGAADRLDDPRRPLGPLRQRPHGRLRRAVRAGEARSRARSRTPTPPSPTGARARPQAEGKFTGEIVAGRGRRSARAAAGRRRDEEPGRGDAEKLAGAPARLPEGRHHHRRQRLVDQRRRGGAGAGRRATTAAARGLQAARRASSGAAAHAQEPEWFTTAPAGAIEQAADRRSAGRPATSISGRSTRPSRSSRW